MIKYLITEIVRAIRKNRNFKAYFTISSSFCYGLFCWLFVEVTLKGVKSLINHFKGAEIVNCYKKGKG